MVHEINMTHLLKIMPAKHKLIKGNSKKKKRERGEVDENNYSVAFRTKKLCGAERDEVLCDELIMRR